MKPIEAEILDYQEQLRRRWSRRERRWLMIVAWSKFVFSLGALAGLAWVLDFALAMFFTTHGKSGGNISWTDMTTGVPLVGVVTYALFVLTVSAVFHHPVVQRRRAVRHAARARLAAQIGSQHPVRQFWILHPYWAHVLQIFVIYKGLELVFGPVHRRRG